ncbi:hypothetical protein NCCP2222_04250 [Sporosarcina sp. NCCP-2222]|uniref:hypothetical protein n=1 Tax=Sporosarcina sp. NCCP-2222 TaxID=2935073 RepID=UPI00208CF120|nr:hypothetical protein [Sporosarcina sp. NCCP-2222]GKV54478.1 hypothetical protein NCCP2222_04250 [Sporosarcina sp. NCCP-2222]
MDKQSYANYLLQLMDEELDDEEIEEAQFYGYFQMFMPGGKDLEATFAPLEEGHAYLQRIYQIYKMLDPEDFNGPTVPGYFTGKAGRVSDERLLEYGRGLIQGLQDLLKESSAGYLLGIEDVEIVPSGTIDEIRQQYEPELYETIFDIISDQKDYDEPIEILDEAYYSIACDYWISYYLQWHRYGLKGDPFAPYFELYRNGYSAVFSENKLYIGS